MSDLTVVVCLVFDHRAEPEGLERFKHCICHCPFVHTAMEVSGTFDMIVQGQIASLNDYTEQMNRIRPQLAEFVARIETNFVGKLMERNREPERFLWVPCENGRKRIEVGSIDKIVAEGDYMRLFIGNWHCLLHSTIRGLLAHLDERFIQLHRSSIVRIDFIDRMTHQDRRWIARLRDGSQQAVAKSHVPPVLGVMQFDSAKVQRQSSNNEQPARNLPQINEKQRKVPA
jgi:hypothetical protein